MNKWYQNISVPVLSILGISLNLSDILTIVSIVNIVIVIILNIYDRLKDKKFTKEEKEDTIKDIKDGYEVIDKIVKKRNKEKSGDKDENV